MTVAWIVFALSVTLLLGVCGLLGELLVTRWGRNTRGIWVGVLTLSGVLPLAMLAWQPVILKAWSRSNLWISSATSLPLDEVRLFLARFQVLLDRALPDLTTFLIAGWGVALTVFCGWLIYSWWTLWVRRKGWQSGDFHGLDCLYTEDTGPGLFGLIQAQLVIPRWVRDLDPKQQEMIAAHEAEHQEQRDPWLTTFGYLALLMAPWNPVLWWQHRRLRLAVELDCDRRAAQKFGGASSYAMTLVEIAEQQVRWLTAFSQNEAHLVTRVRHLNGTNKPGPLGSLGAGAGLLLMVLLIWAPPLPVSSQPPPSEVDVREDILHTGTPYTTPPRCLNCTDTVTLPIPDDLEFPSEVTDPPDRLAVPIYIDRDGTVDGAVCQPICTPSYERHLTDAVRDRRYSPARIWGIPVASWQAIQLPVASTTE